MKIALIILAALALSVGAAAFEAEAPEALVENAVVTDAAALAEEHDLSLDKEVYAPGETITVSYINGTLPGSKWLGIYIAGTALDSNQYKGFVYTTGSTGTATLTAPSAPGMYEMRYFGDSSYGSCYDSVPFTVASPEDTHYMTPDKRTYFPSETITVEYTNGTVQGTKWIGIYKADAAIDSDAYMAFAWTTAPTGTLTVTAPADYGDYELRFFGDSRYSLCFDRVPFSVVHHISLSKDAYYTGETLDVAYDIDFQHWFVVTDVGDTVDGSNYNKYTFGSTGIKGWSYIYTGSGVNTTVRAPRTAGDYEIHLLYNNGYEKVDSIPLTVIERCSLDKEDYTIGETVTVTYENALSGDWVGIYTPDAADTNSGYAAWAYINEDGTTPSGTVTLPVPDTEGSYEVRVFAEHYPCFVERHAFSVSKPSYAPLSFDKCSIRAVGNPGLRFAAYVDNDRRAAADEYGFIIALSNDTLAAHPEYLAFNEANDVTAHNGNGIRYTSGVCCNKAAGIDRLYSSNGAFLGQNDLDGYFFTGVLIGIPFANSRDVIAARPYVRIGGTNYYGEVVTRSLYEVALKVKNDGYAGLDAAGITYIDACIAQGN